VRRLARSVTGVHRRVLFHGAPADVLDHVQGRTVTGGVR
jgi:hypothetical protein